MNLPDKARVLSVLYEGMNDCFNLDQLLVCTSQVPFYKYRLVQNAFLIIVFAFMSTPFKSSHPWPFPSFIVDTFNTRKTFIGCSHYNGTKTKLGVCAKLKNTLFNS